MAFTAAHALSWSRAGSTTVATTTSVSIMPARSAHNPLRKLILTGLVLLANRSAFAESTPIAPTNSLQADAYLAERGSVFAPDPNPWRPEAISIGKHPDVIVANDGSGTYRSVQAAIDAAQSMTSAATQPVHIRIRPGVYREVLCIRGNMPLLIEGESRDQVRIVAARHRGQSKALGEPDHACETEADTNIVSTTGSSTVIIDADAVSLHNFTIENDFDAQGKADDVQAVALTTRGDRILLAQMRLVGHQDTAQFSSQGPDRIARVMVRDSQIDGDTDFVFGRARAVFQRVRFHSRTDRITHGVVFAPAHPERNQFGFLVEDSIFTAGMRANAVALGRAWDHSQGSIHDENGELHLPNGMLVVTRSRFGQHITPQRWTDAATTRRPYSPTRSQTIRYRNTEVTFPANRLYEINNTVDRHDPQSVYQKVSARYPNSRIATAPKGNEVRIDRDLVYSMRHENGTLPLALDLYTPATHPAPLPTIVLVHGGGWRTGQRDNWAALAHALAKRGVIAAPISYRLSGEAVFPAAIHDIKAAVRWLRAQAATYGIRTNCIALAGGSAGGHMAALAALTHGGDFDPDAASTISATVQALINIDGLSDTVAEDIRQFEDAPDKPFPALAQWLGGRYVEQPLRWQQASPLHHVHATAPPTLFITSQETRFSLGKHAMRQALAAHHIDSEEIRFEAPHAFWLLDPWVQPTAEAIANFVQRCAGG